MPAKLMSGEQQDERQSLVASVTVLSALHHSQISCSHSMPIEHHSLPPPPRPLSPRPTRLPHHHPRRHHQHIPPLHRHSSLHPLLLVLHPSHWLRAHNSPPIRQCLRLTASGSCSRCKPISLRHREPGARRGQPAEVRHKNRTGAPALAREPRGGELHAGCRTPGAWEERARDC